MNTLIDLFEDAVRQFPQNPFIWDKTKEAYTSISYSKAKDKIEKIALSLIQLGLNKGDRVALISEGRQEWILAEMAVIYAGAVSVPISIKIEEPSELAFRLNHSACSFVIGSAKYIDKLLSITHELSTVKTFISFDEIVVTGHRIQYFGDLLNDSKTVNEELLQKLGQIKESITMDDIVNISYTSGTTSDPKGIMLTHKNYLTNVMQAATLFEIHSYYRTLLILPWDHSFAHTVGIYSLIKGGASIAAVERGKTPAETLRNISKNIKEIKPHFILSVPALAKSFKNSIESAVEAKGRIANLLFKWGLRIAYTYNRDGHNKRRLNLPLRFLYQVFDWIIFSKIRKNFGGNLEFFVGGGALLNKAIQHFFYAIKIPMYQGYGLTEASPIISSNTPMYHKLGSSGKPASLLEIKICDETCNALPNMQKGEIVIKGGNVMKGYWNNNDATKQTIKDGWLYTGDLGYLDNDAYLHVLGRFKSLLISNDGEKFSPEDIEASMVENIPLIEQIMLYNNQNPYTVALVYPNINALNKAILRNLAKDENSSIFQHALNIIYDAIQKYKHETELNQKFPIRWLPISFAIIEQGFTEHNKMLNSTLKMVRSRIISKYEQRLNAMYTAEFKNYQNNDNIEAMKSLLKQKTIP